MNTLKNHVTLNGNIGSEPRMHTFESGKVVTSFTMATNEKWKNASGEVVEQTEWHNIVAWGSTATFANTYLKKGMGIILAGKIKTRQYEDTSGVKRYITEIQTDEILITSKKESA